MLDLDVIRDRHLGAKNGLHVMMDVIYNHNKGSSVRDQLEGANRLLTRSIVVDIPLLIAEVEHLRLCLNAAHDQARMDAAEVERLRDILAQFPADLD